MKKIIFSLILVIAIISMGGGKENPISRFIREKMHGVFLEDQLYKCDFIEYTDTPFLNSRGDLVAVKFICPAASKKPVIIHFSRNTSKTWIRWAEKGEKDTLYLPGHKIEFIGTRNYYEYIDSKKM